MRVLKLSIKSKSLIVTSLGVRFILMMMAVGIAAVNTGNNLLYLILAMMLSLMVISGVLSDTSLYRLRYGRELPSAIYAGQPVNMILTVFNDKKIIPAFSLLIEDSLEKYSEGSIKDKYFFKLPPATSQKRSSRITFEKRGVYPLQGVSFATRFPFGIFTKIRKEEESPGSEIVVFPRIFKVSSLNERETLVGSHFSTRKGQGISLYQFRPYHHGEDARSIHWKTSARKQKLIVREYEEEKEKKISIGISNSAPIPPSNDDLIRFEKGIELAASYVSFYLKEGYQLAFFTDETVLPLGMGAAHLKEILTLLASLKAVHQSGPLPRSTHPTEIPVLLISPLSQNQFNFKNDVKIFQPDEIDRLVYWSGE
ncbi:MAG: DUF58 domain-containing protein [Nitrospirae bacterium]|nr:DUF58 domain-containing protein [Nitrospirota bacterium]MBI3595353.1 DUF58 domain-containing protein [Nitrospirota bacterium]